MNQSDLPKTLIALVGSAADAMAVVDTDLNVVYANRLLARLSGIRERELLRGNQNAVCHTALHLEPCATECISRRALRLGRSVRLDQVKSLDGDLQLIVTATPLVNDDGSVYAVLEMYRDVTAEARMQASYRHLLERERHQNELLQEQVREQTAELSRANVELAQKNLILEQLVVRDGLTGLHNHRTFQQRLREQIDAAKISGEPLSLILCDVDHFKRYNDLFGHQVGDAVLREVASILGGTAPRAPQLRAQDMAARYGGEEFAVLLPNTPWEHAAEAAELYRSTLASHSPTTAPAGVTMTFGVAAFPDDADTAETLIRRADAALIRGKRDGRDRIVVCGLRNPTSFQGLLTTFGPSGPSSAKRE